MVIVAVVIAVVVVVVIVVVDVVSVFVFVFIICHACIFFLTFFPVIMLAFDCGTSPCNRFYPPPIVLFKGSVVHYKSVFVGYSSHLIT
jgi:hypothetical protein